jgi:ribosomal protein L40E
MLVWGVSSIIALIGAVKFAMTLFGFSHEPMINDLLYLFLFFGGLAAVVINETILSMRKTQLEINRDETIQEVSERNLHSSMILAICPICKARIPSEAKYCLECGADLQIQTVTPAEENQLSK